MNHIFCIMGKSGAGKDTIYKKLKGEFRGVLTEIITSTTRPMRTGEINHKDYHFATIEELQNLRDAGKIIEERVYHTVHGDWFYFLADNNDIDLAKNNYILIGTLESFEGLCKYFGKEKIIPIYITVEDGLRLKRAIDRELTQDNPKYKELCRRFIADEDDFSKDKLQRLGITSSFENTNLDETVNQIRDFITGIIH